VTFHMRVMSRTRERARASAGRAAARH
jgi:hypothetical protein